MISKDPITNTTTNQKQMQKLEILFKSNQFDILKIEVKKLIKEFPNDSTLYNILGIALIKEENLDDAISNFKKAIEIQPNFVHAHNNLGNSLIKLHIS